MQGKPGSNCASQANVVDVAPALDANAFYNRTTWAQSALLWNFVLSENMTATQELQEFVLQADWGSLGTSDGPVPDSSSQFATEVSGFRFDFASQTVAAPPAKFSDVGQPSTPQLGQLNDVAEAALDRMSTFALGESNMLCCL